MQYSAAATIGFRYSYDAVGLDNILCDEKTPNYVSNVVYTVHHNRTLT
jgi:hypothetical protein